jgi:hypothetical protein
MREDLPPGLISPRTSIGGAYLPYPAISWIPPRGSVGSALFKGRERSVRAEGSDPTLADPSPDARGYGLDATRNVLSTFSLAISS